LGNLVPPIAYSKDWQILSRVGQPRLPAEVARSIAVVNPSNRSREISSITIDGQFITIGVSAFDSDGNRVTLADTNGIRQVNPFRRMIH